jgi:proline iminopeptidase
MADGSVERDYSLFGDDHVAQYEATNGEVGYLWNDAPCLVLRTKGRTTGELRKFPLIFGERGDDFVLVASKGGAPEDPGWYLNLQAHPDDVEVQVKGDVIPVRARTAEGDERSQLWDLMLEHWPEYTGYQANTEREIPVVVLERR